MNQNTSPQQQQQQQPLKINDNGWNSLQEHQTQRKQQQYYYNTQYGEQGQQYYEEQTTNRLPYKKRQQQQQQQQQQPQYYNDNDMKRQRHTIDIESPTWEHPYYTNPGMHGAGTPQHEMNDSWKNVFTHGGPPPTYDMDQSFQELSPSHHLQNTTKIQMYYNQEEVDKHQEYLLNLKKTHPRMRRRSAMPSAISQEEIAKLNHHPSPTCRGYMEMEEAFKTFSLSS